MHQKHVVKVPVIMQMEALECGAACLAMVLAYHGKWVPLEQIRTDSGVSRDGSSAKNLLLAARSYGMIAKGYRHETEDIKPEDLPCIIHWNFNHFVVLNGFKHNKAVINDPARGVVEVPMEEFDRSFTGICLKFSPGEDFVADGKPRSVLGFARSRLKGAMSSIIIVMLTGIATAVTGMMMPAFSRVFLDRILTGVNDEWLYPFILLMAAVVTIEFIVTVVRTLFMLRMEGKFAITANSSYIWHVLRLPMEFFSQRMAGDIASRQFLNESIASALVGQLAPVVLNFGMLVFYLVVMLRYSLLLTAVGVAVIVLNIVVARIISKKRVNITRVQMRDQGKLAGATTAGIEMIETIKASGAENGFFERWSGYQAAVNTSNVRFTRLNQYLGALPGFLQTFANNIVLILGVMMIVDGHFTAGMLLAFQGFMTAFMQPASSLLTFGQTLQEMRSSMESVEDVMNYETDVEYEDSDRMNGATADAEEYAKLTGRIEITGLTFGYSKMREPLIRDFDLKIKPGARIALVGRSGCGKSTLSKLISGLYKPWSGKILFDGKPLAQIRRECFTGSLSVIDQDIILFEETIANNIKMWDTSIEDFEMILAARDAQIHEKIMQRDGGYNYVLTEGGKDFSGGERQRLEIARMLAQDPTIIIMDEATSALDAKTEHDVVKAIKDRGITCIVVAHRLSTIRDCDEIIVLDEGKVMERGTHDELFAKGGLYNELVTND